MKLITITLALATLLPLTAEDKKAKVLLQAAHAKETVQGDLKGAIDLYGQAVKEAGDNRALTAKTLVQMADCYHKLGNAESRKIYERVLREYGDQKDAASMASARLGVAARMSRGKGDRAVWTGPMVDLFGRVSPDGRYITFIDWNNGSLMVHDIEANSDSVLTPPAPGYAQQAGWSTFSRDGKRLAYDWSNDKNEHELRVAEFQGEAIAEPRRVFTASYSEIRFISSMDWSPDSKWIAVSLSRQDGTGQIALVALADGSMRVLKSVDWKGPERIFFSVDSKYIAYDLPANDTSDQRDIFVLAIDGSREIPAVVHPAKDALLGWSPDGRMLLFSSDRTGATGLWALPFVDGKPQGTPELLRADIGASSFSLGLTSAGALYTYKNIGSRDVKVAPIDLKAGKLTGPVVSFNQGFLPETTVPNWSPDGKYLAYQVDKGIAIRSAETGKVRQLSTLLYARTPDWSPDGHSFLTVGRDRKGRTGIFTIDVQTGAFSPVVYTKSFSTAAWSNNGKAIYYYDRQKATFFEHNLASGVGREIIRLPLSRREVTLSPDGRYFAAQGVTDASTKSSSLLLVPVEGGQPRELLRLTQPDEWGRWRTMAWTRDSRALVVTKLTPKGAELLLAPIDGTPSRKLDIDAESWTRGARAYFDQGFTLSPDGSHVAFLMGKSGSEVWALENFLPSLSAKK